MSSNNFVRIGGNLTKDPELKYTANGIPICNFTLAVNHNKDNSSFFDCVAWGETGLFIEKYYKKGKYIKISGTISQERWQDKSTGKNMSRIKITANEIVKTFSDKKQQPKQQFSPQKQAQQINESFNSDAQNQPENQNISQDDDDIPF